MKFNDITTLTTPAEAARSALLGESITVTNLTGRRLKAELARIVEEIDTLASRSGHEYARAVLHKEIYKDMARLDEADIDDETLEQSEVIIAAQAMNTKFQSMIEDVADMMGSDMITLVDQIKQRFGDGAGEQYVNAVRTALETAVETLTQTKSGLDTAITSLKSGDTGEMGIDGMEMGIDNEFAADPNAPIFPSSGGPEEESTGREMKSGIE